MKTEWWAIVEDVPPGSSPMSWLVGWLPRGKRHVWLLSHVGPCDEGEVWLVLDPGATALRVVHRLRDGDFVLSLVREGATAVRLPDRTDPARAYFRGWMTCTAVCKFVCGLRWPLVWTPGQLIARARREGFEVLEPCTSN